MSKVYFLGDTHWGHRNICKYRPFNTPEEHDDFILYNLLKTVNKRDTLWLMGDIFFDAAQSKSIMDELEYIRNIRWVLGNHDAENGDRQSITLSALTRGWKVYSMYKYKGYWLTHHPIHPQELRGKKNIHGHVHSSTIPDVNYINVSCENTDYFPKCLDDIE